jgi:hemolysin activation/secretion protein
MNRINPGAIGRLLFAFTFFIGVSANAQQGGLNPTLNAEQDLRARQQQEAQERAREVNAPGVRSALPPAAGDVELPDEHPCFRIDTFSIVVPEALPDATRQLGASALPMDRFAFLREKLDRYRGACIGQKGIDLLVRSLSEAVLQRGYVTTRLLLPEQQLSSAKLTLVLVPGVIHQIRFEDPSLWGTWRSAFPTRAGDLLDLRDLEQGLEQMKRVSSQDVSMQIVPTDQPGESDIVIAITRAKPVSVALSVDNSGARSTGKLQGNVSIGVDNPLGLNDLLRVGGSHDLTTADKSYGSSGWNAFYSVPWGYWTGTISAYSTKYFQQIAGINQTFVSSGNSQNIDFKLHRVIARSQNDVTGVQFRLTRRFGKSFIEDTEITQQHRNNTIIEFGVTNRHYFGNAQFDGNLAFRQGVAGFGAYPDTLAEFGGPTYRFRMLVADANVGASFKVGDIPLQYTGTIHGQWTRAKLYYIDDIAIGSRYTVRGFDGESMLAAEQGFYWRNELQTPLGQSGQAVFAGVNYGQVWGPNTQTLVGTRLVGAVIGLRGSYRARFVSLAYELFAGTPIHKPKAFETARVTIGFQVSALF